MAFMLDAALFFPMACSVHQSYNKNKEAYLNHSIFQTVSETNSEIKVI